MEGEGHPFRELFKLAHSEKRGIIVFLLLAWALTFTGDIRKHFFDKADDLVAISTMIPKSAPNDVQKSSDQVLLVRRHFDPNKASQEDLLELGIPSFLAERIVKYRRSGGYFQQASDLGRIYGFPDTLLQSLIPYMVIEQEARKMVHVEKGKAHDDGPAPEIDINVADSAVWTSLKGIGPTYAGRIVKYRNMLGGFERIEQLDEVYGVNDSLYRSLLPYLKCGPMDEMSKLKINELSAYELSRHPYLRDRALCRSIVSYRKAHGPYKELSDLSQLHLMNDSILGKIAPYLSFHHEEEIKE